MSRMNESLRAEIALIWDGGDPFGSAISWAFSIAETLYLAGEDYPDEWEFYPSPFLANNPDAILDERANDDDNSDCSYEDNVVALLYVNETVTADDLVYAGNVLSRFLDLCRLAGVDY